MRISIRRIISYLLILMIILAGPVEIMRLDYVRPIPLLSIIFAMYFLCILGIIYEKRIKHFKNAMVVALFVFGYLIIYGVATWFNLTVLLLNFILLILLLYFCFYVLIGNGHLDDFLFPYENVILLIAIISLFFWIFGSVLNVIPGRIYGTFSYGGYQSRSYNYYYLYFENLGQNQRLLGSSFPRNCGIYCEAPAYCGMLFYGLLIEVLYNRAKDKRKLLILLVTLLSTQSTKALILLIVLGGMLYMLTLKPQSRGRLILKSVFSIVLMITASFSIVYIMEDKSNTYSYLARLNHLNSGLKTWLQNPVFGAGYQNIDAIIQNQSLGAGYGGVSMGITVLLAEGGIFLTLFYLFVVLYAYKNKVVREHKIGYIVCVTTLVVNLLISNSAFSYPYLVMISICLALGAIS